MRTERETFLDVAFDIMPTETLLPRIAAIGTDTPLEYLVTPNVDHIVRLHKRGDELPALVDAYRGAGICVCDSKVLALLARWRGVSLPVVAGSDLTALLFEQVIRKGDLIAIVGGEPEMLSELRARYPGVDFVQHCPPMDLMKNAAARTAAAQFIVDQKARFSLVCVGSPQQELIAAEAAGMPEGRGLVLCVGAALDFITGRERRAPGSLRRLGLEWAYRLASNPKRMWRRYLVEGPAIFLLAYRWRKSAG